MHDMNVQSTSSITRRSFCRGVFTAGVGLYAGTSLVRAAEAKKKVKFFKNLGPGHIGVKGNQRQLVDLAVKYGFESISPSLGEFEKKSASEIEGWAEEMKEKGIRYGSSGLPVQFRREEGSFQSSMARLPKQAKILKALGVGRMATWIMPGHNDLTYLQNFMLHKRRLQEAAKVLKDYGIRLGLEFVGPRTSRARFRYPFICTQAGMMELVGAIGTGNVGLLMDSWHWYTSHGTVEELLRLSGKDIVHVHVNDAPAGIAVDKQMDNQRKLPVTTGVINMKGFIKGLVKIGYDGPVECEPFDKALRQMEDGAALQKTIDSLNRLWDLISV